MPIYAVEPISLASETIAIIGGGITGVHAALLCNQMSPNSRVFLFEKDNILGGRTLSSVGSRYPLGAMRYHRRYTPYTRRLVADLGIETCPWPYRLRRVKVFGRTYDVDQQLCCERSDWGYQVYGGNGPSETAKRFDRYWGYPSLLGNLDGPTTRELIVRSSGYNCLSVLPFADARNLFVRMAERNPNGWLLPQGGFSAVLRALVARLSANSSVYTRHELVTADVLMASGGRFRLELTTPDGTREFLVDKLVLAVGGQDLVRIRGNLSRLLGKIGSEVAYIPKFRAWLRYRQVIQDYLPLEQDSILITEDRPRKLYVGRHHLMIYNDMKDAYALSERAKAGSEALVAEVNRALCTFFENTNYSLKPEEIYWRYWPQGVHYLSNNAVMSYLDILPAGLIVVNEAFSPHHGFIEGGLVASRIYCHQLFTQINAECGQTASST